MTVRLQYELRGKESVYLTNVTRYASGLLNLEMYRNAPASIAADILRKREGRYRQTYEGAVNGDRVNITLRNKARKELTGLFKQILYYLQSVATEEDIPELLQAGIEVSGPIVRRRTVVAPAGG